jgi:hypothetical protein
MNDPNAIDDERAARITERIGETFDFMRDVLDDPSILNEIPDEAEIEVRQVTISGQIYRIVAYRAESGPERWIARTTGRTSSDTIRGHDFSVSIRLGSTVSVEAALDGVEAALKAAEETDQVAHRIA